MSKNEQQPVSLAARLAERREQLQQEHTFELPVPGYEDVLVARYRALDYKTLRKIGQGQVKTRDEADAELNAAADTLIRACVVLLAKEEDGSLTELGQKWGTKAARELFGVEIVEGMTERHALLQIIPQTSALMLHFVKYDKHASDLQGTVTEALSGE